MTRYKDQCIEVEEKFGAYLTNDGMTNQQAIIAIAKEYGPSHAFACATLVEEWNANDFTQDNESNSGICDHVNYLVKKN